MSRVARLAHYVSNTGYADFSGAVIERCKDLCISSVGSTVLGAGMDVPRTLVEHVRASGGAGGAGAIGFAFSTTAELAAMVNCTSSHCTELEDVAWPEAQYTCCLIPAVFSLGQSIGASGRQVIEAIILGFEVAARPGMTCSDGGAAARGWLSCANVGTIGAAAAAAKLMGLDEAGVRDAISLAASMGGGLVRQSGSAAHVLEAGFAARDGLMAAALAARGLGGNPSIMDGMAGYFDALAGQPDIGFDLGVGDESRLMAVGQKKYPCCYLVQRIIDSLHDVMRERGVTGDDVLEATIEVNKAFPAIVKYPEPGNGEEARFSLGHVVAAVLCGEPMDATTFTAAKVKDERIIRQRRKVKMIVHDEWGYDQLGARDLITLSLRGGATIKIESVSARGDASNPLSREQTIQKFLDCTQARLGPEAQRETAERLCALERLDNVAPLIGRLTYEGSAAA